jgi:curved DNA-binding protein CbpA
MSDDRLDKLDYYTLLGVEPSADVASIRKAFRTFAVRYHPDRFAGVAPDNVERATAIYRRGSEALEVLTDPVGREAYDLALARGETRLLEDPETATRRHAAALAARPAAARAPTAQERPPQPAGRPQPAAPAPAAAPPRAAATGPQSLRTPQARAFVERSRAAEASGDLRAAWRAIKAAAELEPDSAWLDAELHRVSGRLR